MSEQPRYELTIDEEIARAKEWAKGTDFSPEGWQQKIELARFAVVEAYRDYAYAQAELAATMEDARDAIEKARAG